MRNLPPGTAGGATTTHPALSPFCVPFAGSYNRSTLRASQPGRRPEHESRSRLQPSTMHACSSLSGNTGREIVHKPHISRFCGIRPAYAQLVKVEQVTAAAHRTFHGDYLAVLPVRAQQAGGQIAGTGRCPPFCRLCCGPRLNKAHRTRTDKHCASGWMAWK